MVLDLDEADHDVSFRGQRLGLGLGVNVTRPAAFSFSGRDQESKAVEGSTGSLVPRRHGLRPDLTYSCSTSHGVA